MKRILKSSYDYCKNIKRAKGMQDTTVTAEKMSEIDENDRPSEDEHEMRSMHFFLVFYT